MMGGGKPVCMEIQGSDLKANNVLAKKLKADMEKIPGLVDISVSQKDPRPELWIEVDKRKASSIGLSVANIAETVHNYFYGKEVTDFRDAGESYDVFTRFTEEDKNRLKNLPYVPVFTPDGKMIRLKNLARIVEGEGPIEIERKNRQRIIKVEADTFRRSLGDVTADIKTDLEKMEIPEGISTSFGGEVYEQKQAFRDLTVLLILGIILVYMVLASLYGNLRDPFIIMFSVPFAFSGVFYAYYFTDTTLSLISFMGIIMLMGIVVKNAVILIDYIRLLQKRREPLFEAVVNGGRMRLRPILMTAFAAFFGLLPMTFSQRVGAEVWNPLGMTMVSGLFVSTLVTLVLVPTIYYSLEKRKYEKVNR
jgi:HAE1 family hydrophobic/amphiphilic exporter-1